MSQNIKTAIIGGGVSGLAAAWRLSSQKHYQIDIYESSPFLGGRAREIYTCSDYFIDNGQHLLSDSYIHLKKLLNELNPNWKKQCIPYFPWNIRTRTGERYLLGSSTDSFSINDLIELIKFLYSGKVRHCSSLYKKFLEPFSLSVFALSPDDVSKKILQRFIKKYLYNPKLYLPTVSLSTLLITPLHKYLMGCQNVEVKTSETVLKIQSLSDTCHDVFTKKSQLTYDRVIFAIPPPRIKQFFSHLPSVEQKKISTIYYQNQTDCKQSSFSSLTIHPAEFYEWKITLGSKEIYISSGASDKIKEPNLKMDQKKIKVVNMKQAVTNISCPELKTLKNMLSDMPYDFIGDWVLKDEPCTLESAISSAFNILV